MAATENSNCTHDEIYNNRTGSFWHIFLEPTRCFESLNARPRFVIPLILCILVVAATSFVIYSRIDMVQITRDNIQSSSFADRLSEEQINKQAENVAKYGKIVATVSPVIKIPFYVLLISGLIMLGVFVTGCEIHGKQNLSSESRSCGSCGGNVPLDYRAGELCPHCGIVWGNESRILDVVPAAPENGSAFSRVFAVTTTSILFYWVVKGILSVAVVLAASDPNSINIVNPVFTNPAGLVDHSDSKVLYNFLSHLDLLIFYTIFLIGLGISKISLKCSVTKGVVIIGLWYVVYLLAQTGIAAVLS